MNETELVEYKAGRKASPAIRHFDVAELACYGCAHSASIAPPPGKPSGERPCCSCIRNPDRERWSNEHGTIETSIVVGDDGHARDFNPYTGSLYNGAPSVYFPMDNYVTLDHGHQERFLDEHPEYSKPIRFTSDGKLTVVDDA